MPDPRSDAERVTMGQRAASAGVRDDTLYQHDALYRESYDRAAASRTGGAQQTGSHWDGKLVPDSGTSFDTSSKGFAWAVVIGGFVLFIGIVNILDRASQYPLGALFWVVVLSVAGYIVYRVRKRRRA